MNPDASNFHSIQRRRTLSSFTSAAAATVCFLGLTLTVTGLHDFLETVGWAAWIVAATSILAGIIRFFIKRESVLLSAICGALIGAAGFFTTLFVIVSGI